MLMKEFMRALYLLLGRGAGEAFGVFLVFFFVSVPVMSVFYDIKKDLPDEYTGLLEAGASIPLYFAFAVVSLFWMAIDSWFGRRAMKINGLSVTTARTGNTVGVASLGTLWGTGLGILFVSLGHRESELFTTGLKFVGLGACVFVILFMYLIIQSYLLQESVRE